MRLRPSLCTMARHRPPPKQLLGQLIQSRVDANAPGCPQHWPVPTHVPIGRFGSAHNLGVLTRVTLHRGQQTTSAASSQPPRCHASITGTDYCPQPQPLLERLQAETAPSGPALIAAAGIDTNTKPIPGACMLLRQGFILMLSTSTRLSNVIHCIQLTGSR
jgi:hypothetical protein